jgi:hypothetical protein
VDLIVSLRRLKRWGHLGQEKMEIAMPKKPTQTQQWIEAGYRHDDPNLWEELCIWLETSGPAHQSALPKQLYYLTVSSKENTYRDWLYEHGLMPVWLKRGDGWLAKKDWRDRLEIMRDPTPTRLQEWYKRLFAEWSQKVSYTLYPDTSIAKAVCLMCGVVDLVQQGCPLPIPCHTVACGIRKIAEKIADLPSVDDAEREAAVIRFLSDPSTPSTILENLAHSTIAVERKRLIATNPNASFDTLAFLAYWFRHEVIANPAIPFHLMDDPTRIYKVQQWKKETPPT